MTATASDSPILLVEDDARFGRELRRALRRENLACLLAPTGREALVLLRSNPCRLVLLDWMLPDVEGPELLAQIRTSHPRIPVLMLTARDAVEDRIQGLDSGADDYLPKPFALGELLARIRRLLHRFDPSSGRLAEVGGLRMDLLKRQAVADGKALDLTPREFDILALLAEMNGEIVSRQTLTRDVWKQENRFTSLDNVIDVHLANLRRKLREALPQDPIETIRGVGFRLRVS
jgi:two-component system copper resistance phosphate regulon response regulator CusR